MLNKRVRRAIKLLIFLAALCWVRPAQANDVYISQSGAGVSNGGNCANAKPASYFNSSGNWVGSSPTGLQIGPGTTVHVCGTWIGSAGETGMLVFQGSGTAGNPVTQHFEIYAGFTAPYWGGAQDGHGVIEGQGLSYVVVDGGVNGVITTTASGTTAANHPNSGDGVGFISMSNSEIKNLTVTGMYIHAFDDVNGDNTGGVYWDGGSNNSIHDNTFNNEKFGAFFVYPGGATTSNISMYRNTVSNTSWGLVLGDGNSNSTLNGTNPIWGNDISAFALWDSTGPHDYYHHDGIFVFAGGSGSTATGVQVYANYIHGDCGTTGTAGIYLSGQSGLVNYAQVFSNVIAPSANFWNDGLVFFFYAPHVGFYTNTLVGQSSTDSNSGMDIEGGSPVDIRDNIFLNMAQAIYFADGSVTLDASDYNDFYGNGELVQIHAGANYNTLAAWQGAGGSYDADSGNGNPSLTGTYGLNSGSAAIGLGANLWSLGITPLDSDAGGNARPSTGAFWDAGAYEFGSGGGGGTYSSSLSESVSVSASVTALLGGAGRSLADSVTVSDSMTATKGANRPVAPAGLVVIVQ